MDAAGEGPLFEPDLLGRLNAPAEVGAEAGVTRYLHELWLRRPDLHPLFDDLRGLNGFRYMGWVLTRGRKEHPIPEELVPPESIARLNIPAEVGAEAGVTRYLHSLYLSREDLRLAFPQLDGRDGFLFVGWALVHGLDEGTVLPELVPQESIDKLSAPAEVGAQAGVTRYLHSLYLSREDLQRAFPDLNGQDGGRLVRWAARSGREEGSVPGSLLRSAPEERPAERGDTDGASSGAGAARVAMRGVNVVGHLRSEAGLAEAARGLIAGLDARSVPLIPIDWPLEWRHRHDHAFTVLEASAACFPVNVICLNSDELWRFRRQVGTRFFAGRYSIGVWWWCAGPIPPEWRLGCRLLDEIWVASEQVAGLVGSAASIPVTRMKLPVLPPRFPPRTRAELGFPEGFVYLFLFDHASSFARKNPLGVIEAFRRAFEAGSGAALVIKSVNGDRYPEAHRGLLEAGHGHSDVRIIDERLPAQDKDAMIAACDCYVALHRAEGFGLPLAEAMYLGKPVIATAYSGNMDFMSSENSYLVDYALTRIADPAHFYSSDGEWAEPDVEHAARLMRRVFEDREEAGARGRQAALDIRHAYSPQAAGRDIERRLEEIRLETQGGSIRRLLHRISRHASRPATTYREVVDGQLLLALQELEDGLAAGAPCSGDCAETAAAIMAEMRRRGLRRPEGRSGPLGGSRSALPTDA